MKHDKEMKITIVMQNDEKILELIKNIKNSEKE